MLRETQVKPLNEEDTPCLEEIRDVLKKHGKLDRFGITLLHKHFDLADDEMMMEEVDEQNRAQIIRPVKREDALKAEGDFLETSWSLHEGEVLMGCRITCVRTGDGHSRQHVYTSTS